MVGNKTFLFAIILLCLYGCANDSKRIVYGEFISVTDSRPCSDSLYAEWTGHGNIINPRYIEFQYVIHNYTDEKMFLPVQTWSDSTVESSIIVYFIDKTDTIYPHYFVKKSPYNSNYLCQGDSMTLFITINQFEKWSEKGIGVSTSLDTLLNKVHLEYCKSPKDENGISDIPDVEFGSSPQYFYEIPRDKSILKKTHKDRVLIRQRQVVGHSGTSLKCEHFN